MITATRDWFKRNRTKFAVGASIIGAGYLAGQYVLGKLTESRQRMSDDRIAKENLRRRFQQNQEDCTYTVLALLPTATENVVRAIPVEQITQELQARRSERLASRAAGALSTASSEFGPSEALSITTSDDNTASKTLDSSFVHASQIATEGSVADSTASVTPGQQAVRKKTKAQLWNELKTSSITRVITMLYTLALLTLLTRIQLNLLGRRNYLSSVVALAASSKADAKIRLENHDDDNLDQDYGSDFETNRKYLTFSWWLLHRGWIDIKSKVESAVAEVFATLTPRDELSFERLSELILDVRRRIEGATEEERRNHIWLSYLLPPAAEEEAVLQESGVANSPGEDPGDVLAVSASLRRLLDETSDLIESPTFTLILTSILDSAFSLLVDEKVAVEAYRIPSQSLNSASNPTLFSGSTNPADALLPSDSRIQELPSDYVDVSDAKQTTCKLATVLAIFTRQAHAIGNGGNLNTSLEEPSSSFADFPGMPPMPGSQAARYANEYIAAMEAVRDLEAFAAVMYSSNFEFEEVDVDFEGDEESTNIHQSDISRKLPLSSNDESKMDSRTLESAWGKALAKEDGRPY